MSKQEHMWDTFFSGIHDNIFKMVMLKSDFSKERIGTSAYFQASHEGKPCAKKPVWVCADLFNPCMQEKEEENK